MPYAAGQPGPYGQNMYQPQPAYGRGGYPPQPVAYGGPPPQQGKQIPSREGGWLPFPNPEAKFVLNHLVRLPDADSRIRISAAPGTAGPTGAAAPGASSAVKGNGQSTAGLIAYCTAR